MKTIAILFFFAAALSAQSVPVTVTFNLPSASYLKDVEQSRFLQRVINSNEGTVASAIASGDTTITISGSCPANGTAIYIDAEPMLVTAGSGGTSCTVTRNSALTQAGTAAAAHAVGATVYELKYPTAQKYFIQVGVAAFVVQCIGSLGGNSAVNGANLAALTAAQNAANAPLVNTAQ